MDNNQQNGEEQSTEQIQDSGKKGLHLGVSMSKAWASVFGKKERSPEDQLQFEYKADTRKEHFIGAFKRLLVGAGVVASMAATYAMYNWMFYAIIVSWIGVSVTPFIAIAAAVVFAAAAIVCGIHVYQACMGRLRAKEIEDVDPDSARALKSFGAWKLGGLGVGTAIGAVSQAANIALVGLAIAINPILGAVVATLWAGGNTVLYSVAVHKAVNDETEVSKKVWETAQKQKFQNWKATRDSRPKQSAPDKGWDTFGPGIQPA